MTSTSVFRRLRVPLVAVLGSALVCGGIFLVFRGQMKALQELALERVRNVREWKEPEDPYNLENCAQALYTVRNNAVVRLGDFVWPETEVWTQVIGWNPRGGRSEQFAAADGKIYSFSYDGKDGESSDATHVILWSYDPQTKKEKRLTTIPIKEFRHSDSDTGYAKEKFDPPVDDPNAPFLYLKSQWYETKMGTKNESVLRSTIRQINTQSGEVRIVLDGERASTYSYFGMTRRGDILFSRVEDKREYFDVEDRGPWKYSVLLLEPFAGGYREEVVDVGSTETDPASGFHFLPNEDSVILIEKDSKEPNVFHLKKTHLFQGTRTTSTVRFSDPWALKSPMDWQMSLSPTGAYLALWQGITGETLLGIIDVKTGTLLAEGRTMRRPGGFLSSTEPTLLSSPQLQGRQFGLHVLGVRDGKIVEEEVKDEIFCNGLSMQPSRTPEGTAIFVGSKPRSSSSSSKPAMDILSEKRMILQQKEKVLLAMDLPEAGEDTMECKNEALGFHFSHPSSWGVCSCKNVGNSVMCGFADKKKSPYAFGGIPAGMTLERELHPFEQLSFRGSERMGAPWGEPLRVVTSREGKEIEIWSRAPVDQEWQDMRFAFRAPISHPQIKAIGFEGPPSSSPVTDQEIRDFLLVAATFGWSLK